MLRKGPETLILRFDMFSEIRLIFEPFLLYTPVAGAGHRVAPLIFSQIKNCHMTKCQAKKLPDHGVLGWSGAESGLVFVFLNCPFGPMPRVVSLSVELKNKWSSV